MKNMNRRNFTKNTLAVGIGLAASDASVWAKPLEANDDVRIGIVGLRKKGKEHIGVFGQVPGVRIVALCDVDRVFLDLELRNLSNAGVKVEGFVDYRKMLEMPGLDTVVISTPDHFPSSAGYASG